MYHRSESTEFNQADRLVAEAHRIEVDPNQPVIRPDAIRPKPPLIAVVDAATIRHTPAFSIYQTQRVLDLLENEGFGAGNTTDLFFTNYKAGDLAGHRWTMMEDEVKENIEEQDRQLRVLIDALDEMVGRDDYVLVYTADHGMTPPPEVTGGWNIDSTKLANDIERTFNGGDTDTPLVLRNRGYEIFLDEEQLEAAGVTADEIAEFVAGYRVGDNVRAGRELPENFEQRQDERLYMVALTPEKFEEELRCAVRRSS
jgi:predicted AlkP superfamily pyrophosphatase or phosphodiesterase